MGDFSLYLLHLCSLAFGVYVGVDVGPSPVQITDLDPNSSTTMCVSTGSQLEGPRTGFPTIFLPLIIMMVR